VCGRTGAPWGGQANLRPQGSRLVGVMRKPAAGAAVRANALLWQQTIRKRLFIFWQLEPQRRSAAACRWEPASALGAAARQCARRGSRNFPSAYLAARPKALRCGSLAKERVSAFGAAVCVAVCECAP
jgi:hypothetical protein